MNLLNLLSALPLAMAVYAKLFPAYSLILLLVIPYFIRLLSLAKKTRDLAYLSCTLSDGEVLLWFFLVAGVFLLAG